MDDGTTSKMEKNRGRKEKTRVLFQRCGLCCLFVARVEVSRRPSRIYRSGAEGRNWIGYINLGEKTVS